MANTCDPQFFQLGKMANLFDPQFFQPGKTANTCDSQFFQPARAFTKEKILEGSPSSDKSSCSTTRSQDKEFIPKNATKFGGVIRIGPGLWKSVYRLSSRGVEFCPEHEASTMPALSSEQMAGVRLLEQPELILALGSAAKSVGPLYKGLTWIQTAQYIGEFENVHIAISCNHQPNTRHIGEIMSIDFGCEVVTTEGPSSYACPAKVIHIEPSMDMILMAITSWTTPCPTALTPTSNHKPSIDDTVYAIGYNQVPTAEDLQPFKNYQTSIFNQSSLAIEEARRCLKSEYRMVSVGNLKLVDDSKKKFHISASLWYGSSGSPIFALSEGSLQNIGYVIGGDAANQNVAHFYLPVLEAVIKAAVSKNSWVLQRRG
ncbi:hypothetical protein PGT21_013202 [Puccinia graminis f. sp. tritici]|uniref:Peptidase S1 domain-containing protein n=1 Tax=Puccinia graminis f. sp. tritici TaxID=56615 RepID=A0A5B0RGZ2_PUCGR|nr:hypothetical protein PGT21_013202 [Puccinia graminis f. sp. tritici]KAA1125171.1 hypothetical protein PGTUg99_008769 [Puccinia graminis f. sp. tritici]